MKPTRSQQMMIDDGLPASLIISQEERMQYWMDNPPKPKSLYLEGSAVTEDEIRLLFELKESKDRGAASIGCVNHRVEPIAQLVKMGLAQPHGFSSTSFYITDAGLKELKKHKRPDNTGVNTMPIVESAKTSRQPGASRAPRQPSTSGKGKAFDIAALMRRPNGCTADEVLQLTGWKAVSMPQQAKLAGVELVIDKSKKPFRYMAKETK